MAAMPKRRKGSPSRSGPPRRGHARLGEPEDREGGLSGPPRRGVARLGEPLRLSRGGLHLGMPATA